MVGMTAMPEAGLARELAMPYASCAVAVNWAAGRDPAGAGERDQGQREGTSPTCARPGVREPLTHPARLGVVLRLLESERPLEATLRLEG